MRADAARNSARILRAARAAFAEHGPDTKLEEIARRAGVGIATLYRRFPSKDELVRAALEQAIAEHLTPAVARAAADEDTWGALSALLEATVAMTVRERGVLAAAGNSGALTSRMSAPFLDALTALVHRGQREGVVRADLTDDDVHKVLAMLNGLVWTLDPERRGWRRYVALVMDALSPRGATPLPEADADACSSPSSSSPSSPPGSAPRRP